jgi:hypothetical protein
MDGADMKRRTFTRAFVFGMLWRPALAADPTPNLLETPLLLEQVKSDALPPVAERLPDPPLIVTKFAGGEGPGHSGGQLNTLVADERDTRLITTPRNHQSDAHHRLPILRGVMVSWCHRGRHFNPALITG